MCVYVLAQKELTWNTQERRRHETHGDIYDSWLQCTSISYRRFSSFVRSMYKPWTDNSKICFLRRFHCMNSLSGFRRQLGYVKANKHNTIHYRRQKCSLGTVVSGDVKLMSIFAGASTPLTDGSRMLPSKRWGSKKQTGGIFPGGELLVGPPQMLKICCHEMHFENLECIEMHLRPGLGPAPS